VSSNVYLVDTKALGFEQVVACYLVKGREAALVDTGYASSAEHTLESLKILGVEKLDYIIPTHVHLDHCGAAWRIAEHYPDAKVLAHERAVKHLVDPSRLRASVLELYGEDVVKMFGPLEPIDGSRVFKAGDGETLQLGGVELTFIYTPGHAPHQLSVVVSDGSLITADAVPAKYPGKPFIIPTTPPPSFDLQQYITSLRKIGRVGAKTFHTPHFGPTPADEEWVETLESKVISWYETAENVVRNGGGLPQLLDVLERKAVEDAGMELPVYARNLLKLSVMGLYQYVTGKNRA
jgi:glyoxylase-like metal-dependent hydrolase (beta-lactamase superfamily II)